MNVNCASVLGKETFAQAAQLSTDLADHWYGPVSTAMKAFDISTSRRQAMFLAQVGHESAGFTRLVESFDYSVAGLAVFGARLSLVDRQRLGRQEDEPAVPIMRQEDIANRVYGGRYGNGDALSGDGWRYRGRGLKQITFMDNYRDCGKALQLDLVKHPELLEDRDHAARSAAWFWAAHELNVLADSGDFTRTTRVINGPALEGEEARVARWRVAMSALNIIQSA